MDTDLQYALLQATLDLLHAWHTSLGRDLTRDDLREMYTGRERVLVMDAADAARWSLREQRRQRETIAKLEAANRGVVARGSMMAN